MNSKKKIITGVFFLFILSFSGGIMMSLANTLRSERGPETIRMLTIGNSFADNACQYLEEITESVKGYQIIIGNANIGGAALDKHADFIKKSEVDPTFKPYNGKSLKDWLLEDEWDVVTIQQVSHKSYKLESYQPYADEIVTYIQKYVPNAKIYIHQTWAYAPDCIRLNEFGINTEQMYKGLKKNYKNLSNRYNLKILKSGDAFHTAYKATQIDLWNPEDRFHANINGSYLAGCVWFSELFNVSARKIQFVPDEMTKQTADLLKRFVPN